jgi:hypothetical protein
MVESILLHNNILGKLKYELIKEDQACFDIEL